MAFQPGNRANPNGRPRGRPDKRAKFRAMFEADAAEVVRVVLEKAKGGDLDACKLVLERCAPKLRDEAPRRQLQLGGATLADHGNNVFAAIGAGELTPEEGAALLLGVRHLDEIYRGTVLARLIANQYRREGRVDELPPDMRQLTLDREAS
jgi:hypothetical protein